MYLVCVGVCMSEVVVGGWLAGWDLMAGLAHTV